MLKPLLALLLSTALALPAHALDLAREEVRGFIDEMVRDHGFERPEVEALLREADIKQPILDAISRPAERVVPWYEYRERFLTPTRIQQGMDFLAEHRDRLARIRDENMVTAILGILGVETAYGRITGRYRVLDALATLAFDYPPRSPFFRSELREFLILAREESVDPLTALGSYAGAMGAPQFISSSYRRYAVDADGDGRRDLWANWDDVIDSVANYLHMHGWRDGEQVVVPATLADENLDRFDLSKIELNETVRSLRAKGVLFQTDLPPEAPAMLIVGEGKSRPQYRVGFNNFHTITRYNRSALYAMAVNDLGAAVHHAANPQAAVPHLMKDERR
ncbi:hypothetical protein ACG33_06360 [Steroidobacter denitrificans]|uniref:Transglycosylase SLT domain-containing protein n=1 Tax=Steroidobacter denitrificans TaxID=465721 RepID=A0A127F8G8_STEDE|nr:lytic murein transglycosylase B [Steroidobacter denitrificans]AMN46724.1 hypothetical protein ACG33_06360 [Steroidobacter denitrificans]